MVYLHHPRLVSGAGVGLAVGDGEAGLPDERPESTDYTLVEIRKLNHNTSVFVLRAPDGA